MPPLLARASRRHLARHPAQLAFAVLGVALGVAVVVAVDLANASALAGFRASSEAVAGRATHQVTGGPGGLPEALFAELARLPGVVAAPVVEGRMEVAAGPAAGRSLRLLGVDPFSEAPFRPYLAGGGGAAGGDLAAFLTVPGAVLLPAATAADLGVGPGDELEVLIAGRLRRLVVVGLLAPEDELARRALVDLAIADVATAQEVLGAVGRLTRVDLRLPEGAAPRESAAVPAGAAATGQAPAQAEAAVAAATGEAPVAAEAAVAALLPAGARLLPTGTRERGLAEMTRAFRLNLTALSLLALVCGLFLIVNSMTFSVVQRRSLFGTLRCLGATRREVLAVVLGEAAAVAAAGTALGLAGGVLLARGLVDLVSRTIDDLYFALAVRELAVDPAALARGAALGLVATVAAALLPAREAASVPPRTALARSSLEGARRRSLPRLAVAAAVLLAAGAALLAWPTPALLPAFAGLFALIVGLALLAPGRRCC